MVLWAIIAASIVGTIYLTILDFGVGQLTGENYCRVTLLCNSLNKSISKNWSKFVGWALHMSKGFLVTLFIYIMLNKFGNGLIMLNGMALGFVIGTVSTVFWAFFVGSNNSISYQLPTFFLVQLVFSYTSLGVIVSVILSFLLGTEHLS
ncbi:hypothetical protein B0O79_3522 [Flavobacteriaceae bacterium MAR_2009_75]|nr:hypothetical protein B0O79_3522 [Flavobacteriaceae bacterium MAR_2009_75]